MRVKLAALAALSVVLCGTSPSVHSAVPAGPVGAVIFWASLPVAVATVFPGPLTIALQKNAVRKFKKRAQYRREEAPTVSHLRYMHMCHYPKAPCQRRAPCRGRHRLK